LRPPPFHRHRPRPALPSFPTRRSSDLAEMLALARELELDPRLAFDAFVGGPLDTPYMRLKGTAMLEGDFDPSFRLALAAKDARRSEEHTSELQSLTNLVCRLLLAKKKR